MTRIAIIIGSTRPGRKSATVAQWIHDIAQEREDAVFEIVDLADHPLPHLDEPQPAAMGPVYTKAHTQAWSTAIASYDGYIFITPEYNHAPTGVLKNAIDYLYTEWHNKAAGFVSYGLNGGTRAVEHLRLVMGELQIADVRAQVALSIFTDFNGDTLTPPTRHRHHHARPNHRLGQSTPTATNSPNHQLSAARSNAPMNAARLLTASCWLAG